MSDPLQLLAREGVSLWLDDLSRGRIESGGLAEWVDRGITGVTTNPAIFEAALRGSEQYGTQLREFAQLGMGTADAARILTSWDVRAACDVLRPVHTATDGLDGYVSLEVDPAWAHDTERTVSEAILLSWLVDRPNLMIKVPATPAGLPAITAILGRGISVNVTLIFSLGRYRDVLDAFQAGLELARENGHDITGIASVASFFISRVDSEVDGRLDALGSDAAMAVRGRAAIANAVLAYEAFEQTLRGERWAALATAGARPQRPLWASTGVKDPAYDDTRYVVDLVAPGTVNTVPEPTLAAVIDHGKVAGDQVTGRYDDAHRVFGELDALGIDMNDISAKLEREGIAKFQQAWRELIAGVESALADRGAAVRG
ncbi:transaldolase [Nocardia sp. NPDC005825]|uniref:transaldolase n=1 Tax=unclassified Nocardia TaxID=2637762 RepID=UPI0033D3ABBD